MTSPEIILARFPGPVRLNPSRRKWLFVLAGGLAFVVIGAFVIRDDNGWGWLSVAFFGLVAAIGAVMLLPGAGGLMLDAVGFEVTSLFKRRRWQWRDVSDFTPVRIPPAMQAMVVYNDVAAQGSVLGGVNSAISGGNSGLPDTYGYSAESLVDLMTKWRARALAQPR